MRDDPLDEVHVVLHGREAEDGSYGDAEVERVYRTRAVAEEYVTEVERAFEFDRDRGVWWIEKWYVQDEVWDERVGDEVIEAD